MQSSLYSGYKVHLIESVSEFDYIKSNLSKDVNVGIDTEDTSLSYLPVSEGGGQVVGYCISCGKSYLPEHYQGFYLPIRHSSYSNNLPEDKCIEFVQWLVDNFKTVFFNRNYDFSMMEKEGFKAPFVGHTHDCQIMAHLTTGDSYPALKEYAHNYLKMEVIEFSSNNAKDHNFGTTDPLVSYVYAAQDPIITVLLARKLWNDYPYIRKIYPIDNKSAEAMRRFSRDTVLPLDFVVIQRELENVTREQASVKSQIFAMCGYEFRLTSNVDKADALCFSDDTEFLTNRGFLRYDDITDNDLIAQYSNGSVEYVVPEGRISRMSDSMYTIHHRYTDIKVTPGHKMWADLKDGKGYRLVPIDDLIDRARGFHILNSVKVPGVTRTEPFVFQSSPSSRSKKCLNIPADTFIEFAGFWLGDGHSTVKSYLKKDGSVHTTYKVGLTQSRCAARQHTVEWLLDLNERMGHPFTVYYRDERIDFQCSSKEFAEYMESTFKIDGVKCVPSWVFGLSCEQRIAFLEAFLRADGTYNGVGVFLGWNIKMVEDLRNLCQISGRKCSDISEKSPVGARTAVKGVALKGISKPIFYFSSTRVFDYSHICPTDIEKTDRPCRVVCFQVPSSVLVVRRNGKISVCGNCRFVTLTQKTKAGKFAVNDEVLAKIDHPLARLFQKYAELEKYRGSYVAKMMDFPREGIHVNYSTVNVSCLTENNKVQTNHGLVSVTDVHEGDMILTRFGYKKVVWNKTYEDDTLMIKFKNGTFIEGNSKHPVLVGDKWLGLGELNLGDRVKILSSCYKHTSSVMLPEFIQDPRSRKHISFSYNIDSTMGACLGFLAGDGSLVSDGVKLCFSAFEPEVEAYYVNLFSNRFNVDIPARSVGKDNTIQYKFCSSSLSLYLRNLGVKPHGTESGLDVTKWSSDAQFSYVAALFDTDGSVNKSGRNYNLRLGLTSKACIDNVAYILRFHGIDVYSTISTTNRNQPLYQLRVCGRQSVYKFIEFIMPYMHCLHKVERLAEYLYLVKDIKSPWDKFQDTATVVSIEHTGRNKVIDIEVEDCHEFIANGIVTHNTGRLSSGSQKGNPYFANFNIQNVKKVEIMRYVHKDTKLGYVINDDPNDALCMMKVKGGLRDAFICPEGYVWLSADYASQEMRVMANFSGEPNLINPILQGNDIHNYIAKQMFGFVDKHHRTKVKTLNFACNYGAGAYTIAQKLGISQVEAQELLDKYNSTLSQLTRWKEEMKKEARRKGIIFTYFGRPRVMYKYYNSSDTSLHAFADRTAMNSPVQGTGGDLIRIDHVKLLQKFMDDKEFADNCLYATTVHDEINLFVKPSYLKKAFTALTELMNFNPANFRVPIKSDPSVGTCWGTLCEANGISPNNRILINKEKVEPLEGMTEEDLYKLIDEYESQPWY